MKRRTLFIAIASMAITGCTGSRINLENAGDTIQIYGVGDGALLDNDTSGDDLIDVAEGTAHIFRMYVSVDGDELDEEVVVTLPEDETGFRFMPALDPGFFVAAGIEPGRYTFTAEAPSADAKTIVVHVTTQSE